MPRQRPVLLTTWAFVGVATVALATASLTTWLGSLPPPEECNEEQLLRWLATRDLAQESERTRMALVDRLEVQLEVGIDTDTVDARLTPEQRRLLTRNVWRLLQSWFEDAAVKFASLPENERVAFLEEQFERLETWNVETLARLLALAPESETANAKELAIFSRIAAETEVWVRRAAASDRATLDDFSAALRAHALRRALGNWSG